MNYQQINLYQPMFRKQKKIFSAVTILQSLAVVLVGFVLFYVYASWNVNKLRNEVANHKRMQTEALAKIGTLNARYPLRKKSKLLETKIGKLEAEVRAKQSLLKVLSDTTLGNTSGFSAHFTGIARQQIQGMWLRGLQLSEGGRQVGIIGSTLQPELVPRFIKKLGREQAFAGAEFKTFQMQRSKEDVARVDFILRSQSKSKVVK